MDAVPRQRDLETIRATLESAMVGWNPESGEPIAPAFALMESALKATTPEKALERASRALQALKSRIRGKPGLVESEPGIRNALAYLPGLCETGSD